MFPSLSQHYQQKQQHKVKLIKRLDEINRKKTKTLIIVGSINK